MRRSPTSADSGSGKNIVTTSLPGLVYPRGSIRESTLQRIVDAALRGRQLDLFIGHRTGIRLRSAGRRDGVDVESVYSMRGLEITDYSRDNTVYEMRDLFGFGQPMDYQGGIMMPG